MLRKLPRRLPARTPPRDEVTPQVPCLRHGTRNYAASMRASATRQTERIRLVLRLSPWWLRRARTEVARGPTHEPRGAARSLRAARAGEARKAAALDSPADSHA